ncbi:hypothetical protein FACS1894193_01550 [Bacilli bacterium]|nr:hypothetical protein FACS1894192_05010 [Bacilli bacterium]GHU40000.1 hypothetical protein FACS1894193_01550 [Bacilli bacterium]
MSLSRMKKSNKVTQESKVPCFRVWKSGKVWLYGASILASLFVFGLAPTFVTNASFGSIVAQADVVKSGTTILVNSAHMNGAKYIYIWNQNTGSIDGQMSYVGNNYYAYTYSGAAPSALTLALSDIDGQSGTSWPGERGNMPVADGAGNVTGILPTYHFVTVNGSSVQEESAPTLTAPSALPDGVSGTRYDLSAQAQPVYATTYATTALTQGNLTYRVTDAKGAAVTMSGATFVPTSAGVYTVTYEQSYTDAAGQTYGVEATQTLAVTNHIATPVKGQDIVSGISTDLSATALGVTSSDGSLTPTIVSVTLDGQPVKPDSSSLTHYTFGTSGTYVVTYADSTGATGTITGKVTPATPTLADTDVSYTDGTALAPTTSIDLSVAYVGDEIQVPDAPQIQGKSFVGVTYNGVAVQVGDKITLTAKGALVYTYVAYFTSLTPAGTSTGQVGTALDAASLQTLVDPNNSAVSITNATITVTDSTGNSIPLDGSYQGHYWVLGTTFTPSYADIYTITYSYTNQSGTVQTATQTVNVLPAPTIDASGIPMSADGTNTLVVNADASGSYHFNPSISITGINQGYDIDGNPVATVIYMPVTYTDPATGVTDSSQFPVGGMLVLDSDGNDVDPATLTIGTYTVEWQYAGANGTAVMVIQILPAGKVAPTISANQYDLVPSGQTVDLNLASSDGAAYVSLTDSNGQAVDLVSALADGSLTIAVTDPFGASVGLTGTSFTTSLNGYYSINYDYTDPTTGLSISAQGSIFVQPQVIAPDASGLQAGKDTFIFDTPQVVDAENGGKTDGTGYVRNPNYVGYDTNVSDGNMSDAGNFTSKTLTDASGNVILPANFDKLQAGTYTATYVYSYSDRWHSNHTNSSTYGTEFQISVIQTVYVSNLTVDNGTGTVGTAINLAALITDKTDTTGAPTSQTIAYALVNADQTLTALPENWTPTQSGTYHIQYSYRDANSGLQVTAIATITVNNGTLTAPKDVTQTATTFTPETTLTDQSGHQVTVTARISDNADLSALRPGTYTITYTALGYDVITQQLTITAITPATTTVDHKANNGDALTPNNSISLVGNVGDTVKIPVASQVTGHNQTGYQLDKITFNGVIVQAGDDVTLTENNALIYHHTKNPVNTDINETKNVDEQGKVLNDTTGYELVSSTVKPAVVSTINPYGDTATITTTVNVWRLKATPTTPVKETLEKGNAAQESASNSGNVVAVKTLPNTDTQPSKPATNNLKELPQTGETSDSRLVNSGLGLMTFLIVVLGGTLKKRREDI